MQTCENFLRSILLQLLYSLPDTPLAIIELHSKCNWGTRRPSIEDMTDCFIAIIKTLNEVWLFGEAFDECVDWNDLWHFLSITVGSKCRGLRFMFRRDTCDGMLWVH
jgi:hypothetical protein